MKVRCEFTVEFDADQYREAFAIDGEHMSVADIRDDIRGRASEGVMWELTDNDIAVKVRHHHL